MNSPALRAIRQELAGAHATLALEIMHNVDPYLIDYSRKRIRDLEQQEQELLDMYIANPIVG